MLQMFILRYCVAEEDRLEVRRQTNEQDKHLDTISDALTDLQRIGEVCLDSWSSPAAMVNATP